MKKLFLSIALFPLIASCGVPVRSDEVGVMVKDLGRDAGVNPNELRTGRHWPAIGSYILTFPTRVQIETWASGENTGGTPIAFSNKDGVSTTVGVSIQLRVDPSKASDLVQRYRQDFASVVDGAVRRRIQGAFVRNGRNYSSEELMSGKASELLGAVLNEVRQPLALEGVIVENMELVGAIGLPTEILARINDKVSAEQSAQTQESRVRLVEAIARQKVAEATGRAQALAIEGEAIRKNPEVLKLREIEKSLGICPMNASTCIVGGSSIQAIRELK